MRYRIAQAVLAGIALLLLAPIVHFGFMLALGQHKYQEKTKVGGKDVLIEKSISYFREGDFWLPILIVAVIFLVVVAMFIVSHNKSGLIPGAIMGTVVVLVACVFGPFLWPKGDLEVFLRGLGTIGLALLAFAVVYSAVIGADLIANRRRRHENY